MPHSYESESVLAEYLLFHYGTADEILPPGHDWPAGMRAALEFPCRTVAHFDLDPVARGLDLGCAVGRSTFEMARTCSQVTGIDFSHAFIRAAEALRCGDILSYLRRDAGRVSHDHGSGVMAATSLAASQPRRLVPTTSL